MKIIFMGTPEFVCPILEYINKGHEVVLVVTQPDRAKGRGLKVTTTPVKDKAIKLGLPISQPHDLNSLEWEKQLKDYQADLFFIVAYSILPPNIFNLPRLGSINLHFSLLPKFRGAAPVQWAIIQGEKTTGITLFLLDKKVDHGNILSQKSLNILPNDTTETLTNKLVSLSISLVKKTFDSLKSGKIQLLVQQHALSTKAPKLFKKDGLIQWNQQAQIIQNQILGMYPFPIAYSFWLNKKKIRIHHSQINLKCSDSTQSNKPIGSAFINQEGYLEVICKIGSITLIKIQLEGKPLISSKSFYNGLKNKETLNFLTNFKG